MTWWIIIGLLALFAVYMYLQNNWFQTTTYRLHLPKASHDLRNKRIVYLSDIDIKDRTKESFLARLVDQVRDAKPDLILLGGDTVQAQTGDTALEQLDHFLTKLTAVAPVIGILGGHELGNPRLNEIEAIFADKNVRILHNEEELITVSDLGGGMASSDARRDEAEENSDTDELSRRVVIDAEDLAGEDIESLTKKVNDSLPVQDNQENEDGLRLWGLTEKEQTFIIKRKPLTRLQVEERDKDYPTILLAHYPQYFDNYLSDEDRIPDLILCGHNHGGQFILPFVGGLYAPRQGLNPKYDYGVFTHPKHPLVRMILGRGIGNSDFPWRFNNRPEIVLIVLE